MGNILFRLNSSSKIGTGHLMRCLTLAKKYKDCKISFACENLQGNLNSKILQQGYSLEILPDGSSKTLIEVIRKLKIDFLIIDSYEIDYSFEKTIKENCQIKLLCFDDTYEKHYCDILLNHNICAKKSKYKDLVPSFCELRCGKEYTLIRDEFYKEKERKKIKKKHLPLRVFIAMGGSDVSNINIKILKVLLKNFSFKIEIVTTSANANIEELKSFTKDKNSITLHIDSKELAKLMGQCDFAIITPSVTANEVIFMNLPFVAIKVVDNQQEMYEYMIENNYKALEKFNEDRLIENIKELTNGR